MNKAGTRWSEKDETGQLEWLWACIDKPLEFRLFTKNIRIYKAEALMIIYAALKKECHVLRGNLTIGYDCRSLKHQGLTVKDKIAKILEHVDEMEDTEDNSVRNNNANHFFIDSLTKDNVEFIQRWEVNRGKQATLD